MYLTEKLLKINFILSFAIAIFITLNKSIISSACFAASFIVLIVLVVLTNRKQSQIKSLAWGIIGVSVLTIIISSASTGISYSSEYFSIYLVFASLLIYLYILESIDFHENTINWIMNWGVLFSAWFPFSYYLGGIQEFKAGYLAMNFSNSNLLGMWVLQATIFSLLNIYWQNRKIIKALCISICYFNIKLILLTGSRNALIALILAALVLLTHWLTNRQFSKLLIMIVSVMPLLFMVFYLRAIEGITQNIFFQNYFSLNKTLDTRYLMWTSTLSNLKGHYLTGLFFKLAGNTHNSHLVILASYGAIVLILTIRYLYKTMVLVNNGCNSRFQKMCLIAFFLTIFMGIGEGSLFSGALGLYIPATSYLLLARYNPEIMKNSLIGGQNEEDSHYR